MTFLGLIPFFFVGAYIVQQRYLIFQSIATALISEVEEGFESNELYRAKYSSKNDDVIEGAQRNPYVYLPIIVQKFGTDCTGLEIIGRLMWHNSSQKANVEAVYRLYRKAERAFPDVSYVKFLRANVLSFLSPDPTAFVEQIEGARKLQPDFLVRFLLYKREEESKIRSSGNKKDGDQKLDLVAYVEFQKYYL